MKAENPYHLVDHPYNKALGLLVEAIESKEITGNALVGLARLLLQDRWHLEKMAQREAHHKQRAAHQAAMLALRHAELEARNEHAKVRAQAAQKRTQTKAVQDAQKEVTAAAKGEEKAAVAEAKAAKETATEEAKAAKEAAKEAAKAAANAPLPPLKISFVGVEPSAAQQDMARKLGIQPGGVFRDSRAQMAATHHPPSRV